MSSEYQRINNFVDTLIVTQQQLSIVVEGLKNPTYPKAPSSIFPTRKHKPHFEEPSRNQPAHLHERTRPPPALQLDWRSLVHDVENVIRHRCSAFLLARRSARARQCVRPIHAAQLRESRCCCCGDRVAWRFRREGLVRIHLEGDWRQRN